jgi:ribonuclease HI
MTIVLQFDGASKGNPGIGGSGAVLLNNGVIIHTAMYSHPNRVTNNVAEYRGLIIGLQMAIKNGYTEIHVEGDSKLVIEQVFGKWKCAHPNMIPLCSEAKSLKMKFKSISGKWIPREKNGEADKWANNAIARKQITIMEAFEKNKSL